MPNLKEDQKAPNFNTIDEEGNKVKLSDFSGKKVILYFYPKDNTPGCTVEAKNFREDFKKFERKGIIILGVSPDSKESHQKFSNKFNLPFKLLVDKDHKIAGKYRVWVEKNMYGKKYMGIQRSTFLIDKKGKIMKIYHKVNPKEHSSKILKDLEKL